MSCCGGRTRTCDLQVMSLASYQLLHSAILTICVIQNVVVMSFSELRVQRYDFFIKPPNVLATFLIKTLKKCISAPFSWLFMSFVPILLTFA